MSVAPGMVSILLLQAYKETSLARLVRRMDVDETSSVCGFVIGLGEKLVLVHQLSEQIYLDGFTVLRMEDITDVKFKFPTSEMSKKVLRIRKIKPDAALKIELTSMKNALVSIKELYPLVVIEREFVSNGECEIGQLKMIGEDVYALRWMTPDAKWESYNETFKVSDITRLQFGGGYETALSLAAGLIEEE